MLNSQTPFLKNFWYLALAGHHLKSGKTLPKVVMNEPLLLGRTTEGKVFALRDICPHRGIPLRYGTFDGKEVRCGYHGWKFSPDGRCCEVPSLIQGQNVNISKLKVKAYPSREIQGNIWVYFGDDENNGKKLAEPPAVPDMGERSPQVYLSRHFPCSLDHAAFGLMDPTHAAFVHTSWWWKKDARKLRHKEKSFEPTSLGWRMVRHQLPSTHRVYRLLGKNVTTEISFNLPGVRIEHVKGDRHSAVALTAITPINEQETEVHQCLYSTMSWLSLFKPIGQLLAGIFLDQDRGVVVKQQEGLAYQPNLMLIDDADTQAKWFYKIKNEWLGAQAEGREFHNPLKPETLRWRS